MTGDEERRKSFESRDKEPFETEEDEGIDPFDEPGKLSAKKTNDRKSEIKKTPALDNFDSSSDDSDSRKWISRKDK